MPFRSEGGLPSELGPLLFDSKIDASLLSGDGGNFLLNRDGHGSVVKQEGENTHTEAEKDDVHDEDMWFRELDPAGAGEMIRHVHQELTGYGSVEIRIRGKPVGVDNLARAGLPKDLLALVVGVGHTTLGNLVQAEEIRVNDSPRKEGKGRAVAH